MTDGVSAFAAARGTRRLLLRRVLAPVWLLLGAVAALATTGMALPATLGYLLLLASVLVVGLPHGAVDHQFLRRLLLVRPPAGDSRATGRWRSRVRTAGLTWPLATAGVGYLLHGGAYLLVWFLAPGVAFLVFVLLTAVHWGLGDLYTLVAVTGAEHFRTRRQRALTAAVRGAIPMLVPLVAFPAEYRAVATLVVGAFDPSAAGTLDAVFTPGLRTAVAVVLCVAVVAALAPGLRHAQSGHGWGVDAGETLLLVAFFAVVPPVVAIGLYFPLWHSLRHVVRVALLDERAVEGFTTRRLRPAAVGFARDAALTTAGALLLFGALLVVVPAASASVDGLVAVYLVLLAVLTLPHAALVAWADHRQGVWSATTPCR